MRFIYAPRGIVVVLCLLILGSPGEVSKAQNVSRLGSSAYQVQYRPDSVRYRTLLTEHFDLIYQTGAEGMARRTAVALEESSAETDSLVGMGGQDLHMPVVINNFNDRSNGFVHPRPFRQEIEAPSIKSDALVARASTWPALVAPHELVHAAHAEVDGGVGVGSLLRIFAPDIARSGNLLAPSGLVEGAAVYRESQIESGAGRLNAPLFQMKMKAAVLSDDPWSLTQMLEDPVYTQPFNRFYVGGAHAFEYLAERDDSVQTDFFRSTVQWHNRLPVLGHGVWLGLSTGQMPYELGNEIQSTLRATYQDELAGRAPFTDPTLISGEAGLNHRRPYWLDDETLVAYVHGYDVRPGFYHIDASTGERSVLRVQELTEDRTYSLGPDTTALYASRYVQDALVPRQEIAEVERVDLEDGRAIRLTDGGRALAPAVGQQETVHAIRNDGPFTRWVVVGDGGNTQSLTSPASRSIRQIAPAPDDSTVAVLVNEDGNQRLYRVQEPVSTSAELTPWLGLKGTIIYDVSWGPKGRYLLFAADLSGTPNVFAYDTTAKQVLRLANVRFGALEPALSPDRSTLAFVNYQHERHDLVRVPFRPDSALVVSDSLVQRGSWVPDEATNAHDVPSLTESSKDRSYEAWRHLAPRMVYPTLHGEGDEEPLPYLEDPGRGPLGLGVGLGVQGSDPLQRWAYRGTAYVQSGRLWGEAQVQTGRHLLRPSVSLFDRALCCGRIEGSPQPVGIEERGAGLGLQLPVTLESNVYQSLLRLNLDSEFRQIRGFGGPLAQPTPYSARVTLSPSAVLGYRLQQNPRDIVPNTGLVVGAQGEVDAWTERGPGSRYVIPRLDVYLPVLRSANTGIRLGARGLIRNRDAFVSTQTFVPRGYDTTGLPKNTYLQLEAEVTQPLWYIDDGLTLLPLYAKALSIYGFGEALGVVEEGAWRRTRSSVGGGLSLEVRLFYAFDVDLRLGVSYKPQAGKVDEIYR